MRRGKKTQAIAQYVRSQDLLGASRLINVKVAFLHDMKRQAAGDVSESTLRCNCDVVSFLGLSESVDWLWRLRRLHQVVDCRRRRSSKAAKF